MSLTNIRREVLAPAVLSLLLSALAPATAAQEVNAETTRAYLEVSPSDKSDLQALFNTITQVPAQQRPIDTPIVVILHGDEALPFTRENYESNKSLVDQAAMLDADRQIDVRICATWLSENGLTRSDVPDFIDTIPFAPEEIERLQAEGYVPYPDVRL